jgi:hypothetical protein
MWDLKPEIEGRPVVIVCPGPSLVDLAWQKGLCMPDGTIVMTVNRAIKVPKNPSLAFITERWAMEEWIQDDQGGTLECVPETPLVTCPEASGWLADVWPDEKRFYFAMPWSEIPADGRDACLGDAKVFSCLITTVLAMDFAQRLGASRIVLLGADFSMTAEGAYYWDVHAKNHPNRHDHRAMLTIDIFGGLRQTNQDLLYHRNVVEACAYWIERSAGIPVVNASAGGIFDWHVKPIETAFGGGTIVDPLTGGIVDERAEHAGEGNSGSHEAPLRKEVAAAGIPPKVASDRRKGRYPSGAEAISICI